MVRRSNIRLISPALRTQEEAAAQEADEEEEAGVGLRWLSNQEC